MGAVQQHSVAEHLRDLAVRARGQIGAGVVAIEVAASPSLIHELVIANARRGITGLLLLDGRACFQVLEGFPDSIGELFAKIERDPRHHGVVRLLHRQTERRRFGDWSMKLARATPPELTMLPGSRAAPASARGSASSIPTRRGRSSRR